MTNTWGDIKNADLVLIMGGNAAEAHPCGFKWVIEAKKHNKAKLVVVDPRFTRSAAVADYYLKKDGKLPEGYKVPANTISPKVGEVNVAEEEEHYVSEDNRNTDEK